MGNQIKHRWEIEVTDIYFLYTFRNLVPFVFELLGKDQNETVTEICLEPEKLMLDIVNFTHYRFRNGEFSYDMRENYRYTDNSVGSEHHYTDFKASIEQAKKTVMRITGGGAHHTVGSSARGSLRFEIEDDSWADFAGNFLRKITETLDTNINGTPSE